MSFILKRFLILILPVVIFSTGRVNAQVNTDQVMRVGQNALYFEDYMLSIQYFNQAIQAKPYLARPYFLRAIAKLNLDDYAGAEADASKALELNPFLTDAWEVRGVARQNLGRTREAVDDYDRAIELLPRNRHLIFNKALALQDIEEYERADTAFNELLRYYPNFDNGYLGRARLRLVTADTVGATADIEKALSINKNALNAYIMRADIAINSAKDYKGALEDMNTAIRLQPKFAGLYINRAFLRYNLDDYFGAMADYDYALQLEPLNQTALFNRGLLLTEVSANDRALEDFTRVLELAPDDYRALYNRALIYRNKGDYRAGIADINRVIEAFPDFPGAYYMRSELNRCLNDLRASERDYNKAIALAKAAKPIEKDAVETPTGSVVDQSGSDDVPAELVSKRFATLLTVDDNANIEEEYNNTAIRGRVQDRNFSIEREPLMELSYYSSPTELREDTYYIKEVDDLNATRILRFVVVVTNALPNLDEEIFKRHFESIAYYNSYIATHTPRAIDYIGRALDFITTRDYDAAIADIDRALVLTPDFAPAYMIRGQANYHKYELMDHDTDTSVDAVTRATLRSKKLNDALDDYNKAVELAPATAPAWFNKGNILIELEDYTSALASFSRAIELKDDMGEAYFNRGYVYLKLGNRAAGIADLSKAGELGIVGAYNLIKRISK